MFLKSISWDSPFKDQGGLIRATVNPFKRATSRWSSEPEPPGALCRELAEGLPKLTYVSVGTSQRKKQWIKTNALSLEVLRIRDMLVRIHMRMRILGSVPLTNGSECGSGRPNNAGTFISFFKDKKVIKKSQNSRNQGFLTIFAWWWKDLEPYLWLTNPDAESGSAPLLYR